MRDEVPWTKLVFLIIRGCCQLTDKRGTHSSPCGPLGFAKFSTVFGAILSQGWVHFLRTRACTCPCEQPSISLQLTSQGRRCEFMKGTNEFECLVSEVRQSPEILSYLDAQDKDLCKVEVRLAPEALARVFRFDEWFKSNNHDDRAVHWNEVRIEIAKQVLGPLTRSP